MPVSLYLAWKYHDDFDAAITANAMVGGDNCHRGAVVGSLLGAAHGADTAAVGAGTDTAFFARPAVIR